MVRECSGFVQVYFLARLLSFESIEQILKGFVATMYVVFFKVGFPEERGLVERFVREGEVGVRESVEQFF